MKRALAAGWFLALAAPAFADEDKDALVAIRSLIHDVVENSRPRRLEELRYPILKSGNAGKIWIEETRNLMPFSPNGQRGDLLSATKLLFEGQTALLLGPVRGLLADPSIEAAIWGADISQHLGLGAQLGSDLAGLFDRKDRAVIRMGYGVFEGVVDPAVTERLVVEAKKQGDRGFAALFGLTRIETAEAHEYLRQVAGDPAEDGDRRKFALAGLEPFLGEDDRLAALQGLTSGDPALVRAAFLAFCDSGVVPPAEELRAALPHLDEDLLERVETSLVQGGEASALDEVMKRAAAEQDTDERYRLYEIAVLSPLPARIAGFRKVLETEPESRIRAPLLRALGASGDPASFESLVPFLASENDSDCAAESIAALARAGAVPLRAAVRAVLKPKNPALLQTFVDAWRTEEFPAKERIAVGKILVELFEQNVHLPRTREALQGALFHISGNGPEGADEEPTAKQWRAWLDNEIQKARED